MLLSIETLTITELRKTTLSTMVKRLHSIKHKCECESLAIILDITQFSVNRLCVIMLNVVAPNKSRTGGGIGLGMWANPMKNNIPYLMFVAQKKCFFKTNYRYKNID